MLPICVVGLALTAPVNVARLFTVQHGLGLVLPVAAFFPAWLKSTDASLEASEDTVVFDPLYPFGIEVSATFVCLSSVEVDKCLAPQLPGCSLIPARP